MHAFKNIERQGERDGGHTFVLIHTDYIEREFLSLVHSPNTHNDQSWTEGEKKEAEIERSMNSRVQLCKPPLCLPGYVSRKLRQEQSWDLNQELQCERACPNQHLKHDVKHLPLACVFERQGYRDRERRDLPSAVLFLKWLQQPGLG